jgi:hypothetical protein
MKEFDFNVNITETQIIEYAVSVEAESLEEAKQKAQDLDWLDVLDNDILESRIESVNNITLIQEY